MSLETEKKEEVKEPATVVEAMSKAWEDMINEKPEEKTPEDKSGEKTTEHEAKPSAPVTESTPPPPESAVPEWAKSLDLKDEDTVEAINHFVGAESADWTRTPTNKMDPAKLEKFKKVQSSYEKDRVAKQKAEVAKTEDPFIGVRRLVDKLQTRPDLKDKLIRLNEEIGGETAEERRETKQEIKDYKKILSEKAAEGNWDSFNDTIDAMLEEKLAKVVERTERRTLEQVDARETERIQRTYHEGIYRASETLRKQEGERYERFTAPDDTGVSPLARVLSMRYDPATGEQIVRGDNPQEDLVSAYSYLLARSRAGAVPKIRPVLQAQPTPKQTQGAEPDLTDAEMNMPLREVLKREYNKLIK